MSDWRIGDKAKCIDDVPQTGDRFIITCIAGFTYRVIGVLHDAGGPRDRCSTGLQLEGVRPPEGRIAFCADRFEKVSA